MDGPLDLVIRYPTQAPLALAESINVWGSVGTGRATLTVDRQRVRVEPNGAFIGRVPVPTDPSPVLEFAVELDGHSVLHRITLARAVGLDSTFVAPRQTQGWVRLHRPRGDTLDAATQRHPLTARWFPGGPFALTLPLGARLPMDARTDDAVRVRLSDQFAVWVLAAEADTLAQPRRDPLPLGPISIMENDHLVELSAPLAEPLPSVVDLRGSTLRWSIFGARHASAEFALPADTRFLRDVRRHAGPDARADVVELRLAGQPAGWRVRWVDGRLMLQIRRPRAGRGIAGLVVALDAGHPPAGTTGPTGLREDSVTLEIARVAARQLEQLGARPVLVRPDPRPLSLSARIAAAEAVDADVLVSIHLDAPADNQVAEMVDGTRVFYHHPMAEALAVALHDSVSTAMRQHRRGIRSSDLVVLRSTWFPSVLIEGTALVLPKREVWLRTPAGIEAYANGIVGGLVRWSTRAPSGT